MTMTLAELQAVLESYPDQLQRALARQLSARMALKRVKDRIAEAASNLGESGDDEEAYRLRESYAKKKAQIELEIRRNPQQYGFATKPTESAIQACIQTDASLQETREQLQQAERRRVKGIQSGLTMRRDREPKPTTPELAAELEQAETESAHADISVQVLQATFETYTLLTRILTSDR